MTWFRCLLRHPATNISGLFYSQHGLHGAERALSIYKTYAMVLDGLLAMSSQAHFNIAQLDHICTATSS